MFGRNKLLNGHGDEPSRKQKSQGKEKLPKFTYGICFCMIVKLGL